MVVGLVLAIVVVAGIDRVSSAATRRARVDAVSDLVALAAVTGGRSGADAVSSANGARLVSFEQHGHTTVVVVSREGLRGVAAAAPAVPGGH